MTGRWVHDSGDWAVLETGAVGFAADLDPRFPRVRIVYKRVSCAWQPWVLEAQSVGLRSIGVTGLGLYALRPFRGSRPTVLGNAPGDRIGRYGGVVLGTFADIDSAAPRAQIEAWAREGRSSMLVMRVQPGEGWSVVDGANGPSPLLHRINDARGIAGRSNNVRFNENGYALTTRNLPAADLQAATLAAIAPSELFVSYEAGAPGYWRIHRTLGQNTNPVIVEASIETRLSRMQMHACPPGRGSLARSEVAATVAAAPLFRTRTRGASTKTPEVSD